LFNFNYVNSIDSSLKSSLEKICQNNVFLNNANANRYTTLQYLSGVSPLYRLDLAGWEFVAFPIFAFLLSYFQFMVLKSLFLYYSILRIMSLLFTIDEALAVWDVENEK
jgi:hypothetical protein